MPRKSNQPATHFVVERYNWRAFLGGLVRLPGSTQVASFDTYEQAEKACHEKEQAIREKANPFDPRKPFADVSDMPEEIYLDWLQDHNIVLPERKKGVIDWSKWWAKASKKWKPSQKQAAWEPLTKSRYFRVVEKPKRDVGYAVVRIDWAYNDDFHYPAAEGGELLTVYRSREKAEAACEIENQKQRKSWGQYFGADMNNRLLPGADPFEDRMTPPTDGALTAEDVPFCEVIEVELELP